MKILSEAIESIFFTLEDQSKDKLNNMFLIGISIVYIVCLFFVFRIIFQQNNLIKKAKELNELTRKGEALILSEKMFEEKNIKLLETLSKNTLSSNFTTFLETKMTELEITAEAGWKEQAKKIISPGDIKIEEEKVELVLKQATTQQIIELLNDLRNEPSLVLKKIEIKNNFDSLSVNISISSLKNKQGG